MRSSCIVNHAMKSARAKLDRAAYLLDQLEQEVESDKSKKKYGTAFDVDPLTNDLVMKALIPEELFVHYSLLASEVIGHARSALDHAIWEMVPSVNRSKRTAFPVFTVEADYDREINRLMNGINSNAAVVIRSTQPFGPNPERNSLYTLHQLWNSDKHRLLSFCTEYPVGITIYYAGPGTEFEQRLIKIPEVVEDGLEFFRERHPGPHVEVSAEVARIGIRFDDGPNKGDSVIPMLSKLVDFSRSLVETLATST